MSLICSAIRYSFFYLRYLVISKHKKGYGVHSPFVFDLITKVFNDKLHRKEFEKIELTRKLLLVSNEKISLSSFGAGSRFYKKSHVKLKKIARYSSVSKKYGKLLFNIIDYFKPETVIELGTACGISTLYLAYPSQETKVYSVEGHEDLANIARRNLKINQLKNVDVINKDFDEIFDRILYKARGNTLVYVDGNHTKAATLRYFEKTLSVKNGNTIIIIDDIYWSKDMEKAWKVIKAHQHVSLTIDLFRFGIVFFKEGMAKQDFIIKF